MSFVRLTSRIPSITASAEAKSALAVAKTSFDIQSECQERSRVDTGQMRNGWQVVRHGELTHEVFNSVEHTIYNELGTEAMPAQPMLTPAVESAREPFAQAVAAAWRQ